MRLLKSRVVEASSFLGRNDMMDRKWTVAPVWIYADGCGLHASSMQVPYVHSQLYHCKLEELGRY